jgi:hypothetical protein
VRRAAAPKPWPNTDIAPELIGPHPDFGAVLALEGIAAGAKQNCAGR